MAFDGAMRSLIALVPIARDAEHLAVLGGGVTALGPRRDVIAVHLVQSELMLTGVVP